MDPNNIKEIEVKRIKKMIDLKVQELLKSLLIFITKN